MDAQIHRQLELPGLERFFESLKPKSLGPSCAHEI
jgi:hypothetical protein